MTRASASRSRSSPRSRSRSRPRPRAAPAPGRRRARPRRGRDPGRAHGPGRRASGGAAWPRRPRLGLGLRLGSASSSMASSTAASSVATTSSSASPAPSSVVPSSSSSLLREREPRPPRERVRLGFSSAASSPASAAAAATASSPPCCSMILFTKSALRRRRKPSMPSSDAIACRSASGLRLKGGTGDDGHVGPPRCYRCRWASGSRCNAASRRLSSPADRSELAGADVRRPRARCQGEGVARIHFSASSSASNAPGPRLRRSGPHAPPGSPASRRRRAPARSPRRDRPRSRRPPACPPAAGPADGPVIAARKYLRETAASHGCPSARKRSIARSTRDGLRRRLGEVRARVEDQPLGGDARGQRDSPALAHEGHDVGDDVAAVVGEVLHLGRGARVHDDQRRARPRRRAGKAYIAQARTRR